MGEAASTMRLLHGLKPQIKHGTLQELHLTDRRLDAGDAKDLARWMASPNCATRRVYLSWNQVGSRGARYFARLLPHSKITVLDLSVNAIGDEGARALADALAASAELAELRLEGNQITDEGAGALLNAAQQSPSLLVLDLANNPCSAELLDAAIKVGLRPSLHRAEQRGVAFSHLIEAELDEDYFEARSNAPARHERGPSTAVATGDDGDDGDDAPTRDWVVVEEPPVSLPSPPRLEEEPEEESEDEDDEEEERRAALERQLLRAILERLEHDEARVRAFRQASMRLLHGELSARDYYTEHVAGALGEPFARRVLPLLVEALPLSPQRDELHAFQRDLLQTEERKEEEEKEEVVQEEEEEEEEEEAPRPPDPPPEPAKLQRQHAQPDDTLPLRLRMIHHLKGDVAPYKAFQRSCAGFARGTVPVEEFVTLYFRLFGDVCALEWFEDLVRLLPVGLTIKRVDLKAEFRLQCRRRGLIEAPVGEPDEPVEPDEPKPEPAAAPEPVEPEHASTPSTPDTGKRQHRRRTSTGHGSSVADFASSFDAMAWTPKKKKKKKKKDKRHPRRRRSDEPDAADEAEGPGMGKRQLPRSVEEAEWRAREEVLRKQREEARRLRAAVRAKRERERKLKEEEEHAASFPPPPGSAAYQPDAGDDSTSWSTSEDEQEQPQKQPEPQPAATRPPPGQEQQQRHHHQQQQQQQRHHQQQQQQQQQQQPRSPQPRPAAARPPPAAQQQKQQPPPQSSRTPQPRPPQSRAPQYARQTSTPQPQRAAAAPQLRRPQSTTLESRQEQRVEELRAKARADEAEAAMAERVQSEVRDEVAAWAARHTKSTWLYAQSKHKHKLRADIKLLLTHLHEVMPPDVVRPGQFAVDDDAKVKKTYFRYLLKLHPDKLAGADAEVRVRATAVFDAVKKAYDAHVKKQQQG